MNEHTLIVVKPDGVVRGLTSEILRRFESIGLKLVAGKMIKIDKATAEKHYPADRDELWVGIGNKTLENYKKLELDAQEMLGTTDAKKIGDIVRVWLLDYIVSGPVFAAVFEGPHAVELIRKICGHTLPLQSPPGTIRGDFSFDSAALANKGQRAIKNLIHASGTLDEAKYEIPLWFDPKEIQSYKRVEEEAMA